MATERVLVRASASSGGDRGAHGPVGPSAEGIILMGVEVRFFTQLNLRKVLTVTLMSG